MAVLIRRRLPGYRVPDDNFFHRYRNETKTWPAFPFATSVHGDDHPSANEWFSSASHASQERRFDYHLGLIFLVFSLHISSVLPCKSGALSECALANNDVLVLPVPQSPRASLSTASARGISKNEHMCYAGASDLLRTQPTFAKLCHRDVCFDDHLTYSCFTLDSREIQRQRFGSRGLLITSGIPTIP
ncbi:hypothetical protein SISSUDRAFT_312898 [Sistotremastrum suecicum HHB10207 ss-3]|uniref:Uncharacterized protein n=1 Tax=Sistotremastrum suecicum HHB10207 ss-3 TaxID=1314776 RepID=A0A165ZBV2_9AGAM|nr:hypothetical protein SISSUDRAFT_312898 [Sistotremastrum suecicum HHB10207 ss-3]